jgi:phytoene dehydrogenase-like protein
MGVHLSDQSFGDNSDRRADYSDFLKRFQEDPHSISTEEAAQRYQELVSHAPPELAAEANQHIMGLLPQNDRDVLADNIHGSQQHFGLLDNVLGKDSVLNTPLGKMALSAAAAYLANRMLGQPQSQVGTRAPSGLGDLLASFLGGGATGNQAPAGGLGDILGALMGGAPADAPEPAADSTPEQPPVRSHRKQ